LLAEQVVVEMLMGLQLQAAVVVLEVCAQQLPQQEAEVL
jgi:hypothetical protein